MAPWIGRFVDYHATTAVVYTIIIVRLERKNLATFLTQVISSRCDVFETVARQLTLVSEEHVADGAGNVKIIRHVANEKITI